MVLLLVENMLDRRGSCRSLLRDYRSRHRGVDAGRSLEWSGWLVAGSRTVDVLVVVERVLVEDRCSSFQSCKVERAEIEVHCTTGKADHYCYSTIVHVRQVAETEEVLDGIAFAGKIRIVVAAAAAAGRTGLVILPNGNCQTLNYSFAAVANSRTVVGRNPNDRPG